MQTIDFKRLSSKESISLSFGIPVSFIEKVISTPDKYYQELCIPKKGRNKGQHRIVYKANERLAHLHSEIKTHIEHNIYSKDKVISDKYVTKYAYGFIKRKGIVQNARNHLNKKKLLCVDIENFFKSITTTDTYHVLTKLGTPKKGAKTISKLITYNGKLEEGLHCSPLISNLYCYRLDHELAKLASNHNCSYTRYADDISFSGNQNVPRPQLIEQIFKKYHFKMNKKKTRFSKQGQSQYVTGLSVSDSKYPRIPKPMKKKLRQELYYIGKYGLKSHCERFGIYNDAIVREIERLDGWLRYLSSIEPALGKEYTQILNDALK